MRLADGTWTRLACLALGGASACVGVHRDGSSSSSGAGSPRPGRDLVAVKASELRATSGELVPVGPARLSIQSPTFRVEYGRTPRSAAEVEFVYEGPTAAEAPLASGELRRQIGLKLRARDSCNVVYVMWHIEPASDIVVSLKSNPGQSRHAECRDGGYSFLQPVSFEPPPPIGPGQSHVLGAEIRGRELRVTADGKLAWIGELPVEAFRFDGPIGLRADNGAFSVELRAERSARQ